MQQLQVMEVHRRLYYHKELDFKLNSFLILIIKCLDKLSKHLLLKHHFSINYEII